MVMKRVNGKEADFDSDEGEVATALPRNLISVSSEDSPSIEDKNVVQYRLRCIGVALRCPNPTGDKADGKGDNDSICTDESTDYFVQGVIFQFSDGSRTDRIIDFNSSQNNSKLSRCMFDMLFITILLFANT